MILLISSTNNDITTIDNNNIYNLNLNINITIYIYIYVIFRINIILREIILK